MAAPSPFLLGVATSGYQSEGGYNGTGQPQNNWATSEACGRVATTGRAVDFWNRYASDFALCGGMGLNAFRLSIEWSRVQPSTARSSVHAPAFDDEALEAYAVRLAACREAGLEPVVTLQHFTHPAWLGTDAWLEDSTPAAFEEFARHSVTRINRSLVAKGHAPVRWYVTLNEPNMLVLNTYLSRHFPGGGETGLAVGVRAYNRLLAAHVRAYNAIHDIHEAEGWPRPQATMNTFCSDVYWSENLLLDLLCVREEGIADHALGAHLEARAASLRRALSAAMLPVRRDLLARAGRLVHRLADHFAARAATAEGFRFLLDVIARAKRPGSLDFLGIDYYDPFLGHIFRPPSFDDLEFPNTSLHGHLMDGLSSKWWDWHVLPGGLSTFCSYYSQAFRGRGVLIAENGMAQRCRLDNQLCSPRRDRITRSDFLREHFAQVVAMREAGVPVLGYLHWSLTDNYEWGSFTPRFGIYRIDYANDLRRVAVDRCGDCPSDTYREVATAFFSKHPV